MPHFPFPDFIGGDVKLTSLQGTPSISFRITDDSCLREVVKAGGQRFINYAFIPTTSPVFQPSVGPPDVEVYKIDTSLRIVFLRERERRYENMPFPDGTQALVLDTDYPVDQTFADNLCGYCTGLIGMKTQTKWMSAFYEDLAVGSEATPFAKRASLILNRGTLHVASPWPTQGWQSNGIGGHAHVATNKLLNGDTIEMKDMLTTYQWPSRMSVAIFFKKRPPHPDDLLLTILKKRAEIFCGLYSAAGGDRLHSIQDVRWVDTSRCKYWNEWDKESFSTTCKAARSRLKKNRKHEYIPEEYDTNYRSDFGRKQKVGIEDISTETYDL